MQTIKIRLMLLAGLLAMISTVSAEIYKDYAPSEQQVQLTVVAVEPNYLDEITSEFYFDEAHIGLNDF